MSAHAALMDGVYRRQKHIYDLTRKFYLFGRDRLIASMHARAGQRVLELGVGTGRNLARIGARWPGVRLYGLDISAEMLGVAAARKRLKAVLAQGDACAFDPRKAFGCDAFDHVVLSYALSMIPDWPAALDGAARALARGGRLHVVDFGDLRDMPGPLAKGLRAWLRLFHVAARDSLPDVAQQVAAAHGLAIAVAHGPLRYYQTITLIRPI